MNICEEIPQILQKQDILMLEKSAVKNSTKESDPQKYLCGVHTFMLNKEDHSNRKKVLIPDEISFDLNNPYSLKPDDSNIDSLLDITRKSEKLCKGNYSLCKVEEKELAMPFSIIKNRSNFSSASLPNGVENDTNSYEEITKIGEKNPRESVQLMTSTDKHKVSKKRRHEDGVFDSSKLEECDATEKKILFKTEKECFLGNPYLEYILKSENSYPDIYFNRNSEGHDTNNRVTSKEKMSEKDKSVKNGVDIFGNHLTAKDKNKLKVICPHCTKKVPAPGFVRHLTYCMRVSIRKRTRRS